MKRIAPILCVLAMAASSALGLSTTASATTTQSMLDASTITISGADNGDPFTTRPVAVPAGGGLGVYGKNTSSNIVAFTRLNFRIIRDDNKDVTDQFVTDYLNEGNVINQRVTVSAAHRYHVRVTCQFVIAEPWTTCNGTFTVSAWG
ncbi:hypothetical protein ACFV1L_21290 [Kitasatospora sp. NPDC059646]|uniref:hypothetical protein n=1 Tax=Kitasatospora sp. NPDC059646 TaxID=3346893 RepID=UPI00369FF05C